MSSQLNAGFNTVLPSFQPQGVLIVEDEPRMRTSLKELLQKEVQELYEAEDGATAIRLLQSLDLDLVLLDINLPDISGLEIMQWIAEHRQGISVIFVSADQNIDSAILALRTGAKDFVRKPYDSTQIKLKVRQALSQKRLEQSHALMTMRLEQSERLHRFLVEHSPDLVYTLDPFGCFTLVNSRFESMLGYMREELLGKPYHSIVHEDDISKAHFAFNERRRDHRVTTNVEIRLKCKDKGFRTVSGQHVVAMLSAMGIYEDAVPAPPKDLIAYMGTYGVARDITERKLAEETIAFHAYYDQLTRLPNQRLLKDRLEVAIANSKRRGVHIAVIFIDVDRFKLVNDTYGHAEGDQLLISIAQRLSSCIRSGDTVARKGGDEFVALLPDLYYSEDATIIASKMLKSLEPTFLVGGQECRITASIGVAIYPHDGETVDLLLKHADIAMYSVKSEGKNDVKFYTPDMSTSCQNRIVFENQLRKALAESELELYFQPQVSVSLMQVVGVEALVRWRHPLRGLLYPGEFISIAEEAGMIGAITDWVLEQACSQLAEWRSKGLSTLKMAVNVTPQEFDRPDFVEQIVGHLEKHNLPPGSLELEITENALLRDSVEILDKLKALRALGVHISIDDFGTCYSSLNYLKHLPVNAIKIDKSFVCDISDKHRMSPIIPAIIGIAQGFGLQLIAEGIETDFQMNALHAQGCTDMQGYFFSYPLPAKEVEPYLLDYGIFHSRSSNATN